MSGGSIKGNTCKNYDGNGVCMLSGSFKMSGGEISGNKVEADGGGGGVFLEECPMIMSGGIISGNTGDSGGGICAYNCTVSISGGIICDNEARNTGGGILVWGEGSKAKQPKLIMSGGTISGNKVGRTDMYFSGVGRGGGVMVGANGGDGSFYMSGGTIEGNTAMSIGNGVFVTSRSKMTMSGKARIDADNEVFLMDKSFIDVTGPLTAKSPVAMVVSQYTPTAKKPVAVINASKGVAAKGLSGLFVSTFDYSFAAKGNIVNLTAGKGTASKSTDLLNAFEKIHINVTLYTNDFKEAKVGNQLIGAGSLLSDGDLQYVRQGKSLEIDVNITDVQGDGADMPTKAISSIPDLMLVNCLAVGSRTIDEENNVTNKWDAKPFEITMTLSDSLVRDGRKYYLVYLGDNGMVHCLYDLDKNPATVTFMVGMTYFAFAYSDSTDAHPLPVTPLATPTAQPTPTPEPIVTLEPTAMKQATASPDKPSVTDAASILQDNLSFNCWPWLIAGAGFLVALCVVFGILGATRKKKPKN